MPDCKPHDVAMIEVERLRKALREIEIRTLRYAEAYDEWPLVAGINEVARKALGQ